MRPATDPLPRVHRKRGVNMQNNNVHNPEQKRKSEIISQIEQMLNKMSYRNLNVLFCIIKHITGNDESN